MIHKPCLRVWVILYENFKKEAENRTKLWNDKTIDFDLDLDFDDDFQERDSRLQSVQVSFSRNGLLVGVGSFSVHESLL